MENKASITKILLEQAFESSKLAINANKINEVSKEVQYSLNTLLLLGIAMEGLINEIGEQIIDSYTWKELEKSSTPLKWRIVSALKKGFKPSEEPMQTISKLQKIRNKIAHPKPFEAQDDIIISNEDILEKNPNDSYELPKNDFNVYVGYGNLIAEYNAKESLVNLKKGVKAIQKIKQLFVDKDLLEWIDDFEKNINTLVIK